MNKNNDCAILTLRTGQLAPKTADGLRNVNFSLTIGRKRKMKEAILNAMNPIEKRFLRKKYRKYIFRRNPYHSMTSGKNQVCEKNSWIRTQN